MSPHIVVPTVVNIEPHHFEAKFKKLYGAITAKDVLVQAKEFLRKFSSTREPTRSFSIGTKRKKLVLRYITRQEDAFFVSSNLEPGHPLSEDRLSTYTLSATKWYRTTGYNLLSSAVQEDRLLSSIAQSPDSKRVRCLKISLDYFEPLVPFLGDRIGLGVSGLVESRKTYVKNVRDDLVHRTETFQPSPSVLSANVSKLSVEQRTRTPISIGMCPKDDFGPSAMLHVPIFAEAYNLLMHPEFVELEDGKVRGGYDIRNTIALLKNACNEPSLDEHDFNTGLIEPLQYLFSFANMELHYHAMDDNDKLVTEVDWVGFIQTPHGMKWPAVVGDGKVDALGNAIVQCFWALQRVGATDEQCRGVLQLTSCPTVIVTVEGSEVRVAFSYFREKFLGGPFFTINLGNSSEEGRLDIMIKFQILRNTVRKLCQFYANLHAGTRHPGAPWLFPQPLPLMKSLLPSPNAQLLRTLSSLELEISEYIETPKNPARALYKGVMRRGNALLPVYIKFVKGGYGEKAHRALARRLPAYAPQLFWCGEVVHDTTMVIMQDLSLGQLYVHPRDTNDIAIIEKDIRSALDLLHSDNLVHGDIRAENIAIADGRGYLIDFDWSGKDGEATYPETLNRNITWPDHPDRLVGTRIWKDHDEFRYDKTIEEVRGLKRDRDDQEGDQDTKKPKRDDEHKKPKRDDGQKKSKRDDDGQKKSKRDDGHKKSKRDDGQKKSKRDDGHKKSQRDDGANKSQRDKTKKPKHRKRGVEETGEDNSISSSASILAIGCMKVNG